MVSGSDFPLNQSNDLGTGLFFMVSGWKNVGSTPGKWNNQHTNHLFPYKSGGSTCVYPKNINHQYLLGIIWINFQSLDTHLGNVQKMKCHGMLLHSTGWSRMAFLAWIVIIPDIIRQYTPPKKHRARGVLNTAQPSAADHQTSLISILFIYIYILISHYSLLYPILPSIY